MHRLSCLALFFAGLLAVGCGADDTVEMEPGRKRDRPRQPPSAGMSAAERLGTDGRSGDPHAGLGMAGMGMGPMATAPGAGPEGGGFHSTTPVGWIQKPASGMRKGSWTVEGEPQTDCSLVVLGGSGGGLALNIDRWRTEMGQPTSEPRPVDKWPTLQFLGKPATYIELDGSFNGGRGTGGRIEDARLLGLLVERPDSMVFLKFTGPASVVRTHTANFEALAASIADAPEAVARPASDAPDPGAGIAWDAPPGWTEQPARSMRLFTYVPAGADNIWCYGSRLRGTAGGLTDNVNRWRREMGQPPLPQAGIDVLPRIKVLGSEGVLIDVTGDFSGTGGPPLTGARLFGFISPGAGSTLFIKMVGPAKTMEAQREPFEAFCRSLRATP